MKNLPILYQNVLGMFRGAPMAEAAFLWAADGPDTAPQKYRAEAFAHIVKELTSAGKVHDVALTAAFALHGHEDPEVRADLERFIIKRAANYCFGGNQRMWWE